MKDLKLLIIFTLGVLATALAGELSSDPGNKSPDLLTKLRTDIFEFFKNSETTAHAGKNKDDTLWSDNDAETMKEIDPEELYEFLPVGSSYVNAEYESQFHVPYDAEDATGPPPDPEEEPSTSPSAAAPTSNVLTSKLWISYAIVVAIMTIKSF